MCGGGYYVSLGPVVPMYIPCQHRHVSLHTNTERVAMKFGEVITTTNRSTEYSFGEIVPERREQDTTKFESTSYRCCRVANDFTNFTVLYTMAAASAVLESPLYTCSGGGIILPCTVFIYRVSFMLLLSYSAVLCVFKMSAPLRQQ